MVYLQEIEGLPDGHANDAATFSGPEQNEMDEEEERAREPLVLVGTLHRAKFSMQLIFDNLSRGGGEQSKEKEVRRGEKGLGAFEAY